MITIKLAGLLFLVSAMEPHNVTMEDFFRQECEAGNKSACSRQAALADNTQVQEHLEKRAVIFWDDVDTGLLMLDQKRPDLQAAYPLVMDDYINSQQKNSNELQNPDRLSQCAKHYHNHWINKKLWYPALENGQPDWPSIYVFIVDHYYGYCLRSSDSG